MEDTKKNTLSLLRGKFVHQRVACVFHAVSFICIKNYSKHNSAAFLDFDLIYAFAHDFRSFKRYFAHLA